MLVVLALACIPLLWWSLYARIGCGRTSFLVAVVAWATYAAAVVESLSLFNAIGRTALAIAWGAPLVAMMAMLRGAQSPGKQVAAAWGWWRREPIAIVVTGYLLLLLAIALVAPPNTWDAMTYHMSRVAHWAQNDSVMPYATHNARQVHMAPGAELLILHLQVLTGGDRLANLVQWFALVGCIVGTSVIARGLGAGPRGQLFAAAVSGSIPMAVLQATSAQNDLVAALWVVCFVALALELGAAPRQWLLIAAAGLAAGLAVLTKTTTLLVLPAFALLLLVTVQAPPCLRVRAASLALLLAGAVNAGYFARNLLASGAPLGPGVERAGGIHYVYTNDVITPRSIASNVLRNLALQAALPAWWWNKRVDETVRTIHHLMGVNPHDHRTTFYGQRFHLNDAGDREDQAQGLIVIVLGLAALWAFARAAGPQHRLRLAYLLCVIASFVLFCAVLRWQPWHTRLHLPMLLLLAPAVGTFLERHVPPRVQTPLTLLVLLASLPSVLHNPSRPVFGKQSIFRVPRVDQYFANRADLLGKYPPAVAQLAREPCDRVGLVIPADGWEYPLWVLLKARRPGVRIEHIEVANYTARYAEPFDPCMVVRVARDGAVSLDARGAGR